jgi:hypothetical protein
MPTSETRLKACPCTLCNGILQPYPTWRRHNRTTSDSATNSLADEIFKMTLKGEISSLEHVHRDNTTPLDTPPPPHLGFPSCLAAPDPSCAEPPENLSGSCPTGTSSAASGAFDALSLLDDQIHARKLQLDGLWSGLQRNTEVYHWSVVREEEAWFCAMKDAVQVVRTHGDSVTAQLKATMLVRIQAILDDIGIQRQNCPNPFPEQNLQEILVDTGKQSLGYFLCLSDALLHTQLIISTIRWQQQTLSLSSPCSSSSS